MLFLPEEGKRHEKHFVSDPKVVRNGLKRMLKPIQSSTFTFNDSLSNSGHLHRQCCVQSNVCIDNLKTQFINSIIRVNFSMIILYGKFPQEPPTVNKDTKQKLITRNQCIDVFWFILPMNVASFQVFWFHAFVITKLKCRTSVSRLRTSLGFDRSITMSNKLNF